MTYKLKTREDIKEAILKDMNDAASADPQSVLVLVSTNNPAQLDPAIERMIKERTRGGGYDMKGMG